MRQRFAVALVLVFLAGALGTQTIRAQSGPPVPSRASVATTVRVTVPLIIKLVVDPTVSGSGGGPKVTVVSNLPELRGERALALETVDVQALAVQGGGSDRGGPQEVGVTSVGRGGVLRYSICSP